MDSVPDRERTEKDGPLVAELRRGLECLADTGDRLERWRDSAGWGRVPVVTRHGARAMLDYLYGCVRGIRIIRDHPHDPVRCQIEAEYVNDMRDYALALYNLGMDAWEEATGSREIPGPSVRPRPQAPPPERARAIAATRRVVAATDTGAGLVYLLRSDLGHHKIGQTRDLKQRRRAFGVKLPFGFEILHTIPTADRLAAEQQIHARFADKRNNGEWFDLTDEDVAYIKSLTEL